MRLEWAMSKAQGISKRGFELFFSFFHKRLKRYYHSPYDDRVKQWHEILGFMSEFETDPKMKDRWLQLRDLSSLLLDEDGAYKIRWLLFLWLIVDRYQFLTPTLIEAMTLKNELRVRGFPKEAKRFYDLIVPIRVGQHYDRVGKDKKVQPKIRS